MKTLISALTLITLVIAPAFAKAEAARPDVDRYGQNYSGTYHDSSLDDWFNRMEQW